MKSLFTSLMALAVLMACGGSSPSGSNPSPPNPSSPTVTTLAGLAGSYGFADGLGASARFEIPQHLAVDGAGNVYVSELNSAAIRKVTPEGNVSTLAGSHFSQGTEDGPLSTARFTRPRGLTVDASGTIYVIDDRGGGSLDSFVRLPVEA